MQIDLKRQLESSGNALYMTDSIMEPWVQVDLTGAQGKMASGHDKIHSKTRKDS